jgi:CBS domain-containing protein
MRVADLMTKGVHTVSPDTATVDAWNFMQQKGIHHLVVMADSKVTGVLSDRDAGGRCGAVVREHSCVKDLMTSPVVTVDPHTTIRKTANLMRGRTIGCVPVVERERLVGILTVSDLLAVLGRGFGRGFQAPRRTLHHRGAHRKQRPDVAPGE